MTELEKANQRIAALEAQEVELCTLYGIVQAENGKLRADLEAIGAGGVSGPLMRTPTSGAADLPEALRIAAALEYCDANVAREAINELRRLHALTAQAPNQPGGFSSGDMASAAAQGYRDGWTAAQAISAEPAGAGYAALPEPLEIDWPELHSQALGCGVEDRGLHNRYECAEYGWQDGVDKCAERVPEQIFDADQMRAFADATHAIRASHGQAPASVLHLVHSAFAEIAMAFPKAFALHKVGLADTAVRKALAAPLPQAAQQAPAGASAEPYGWLYDWTHSSATSRADTTYTGFTKDEAHARKHDNCLAIFTAPQPAPPAGSVLEDAVHQEFMDRGWHDVPASDLWMYPTAERWQVRTLYFPPQPTQAQAGAVPLTHAQAKALVSRYGNDPLHLVYQVEVAHGIKGGQHG